MCIYAMMYIEKHSDLFFIFNTMCVDNYVHSEQDKVRSASVTCGCMEHVKIVLSLTHRYSMNVNKKQRGSKMSTMHVY